MASMAMLLSLMGHALCVGWVRILFGRLQEDGEAHAGCMERGRELTARLPDVEPRPVEAELGRR